MLKKIVHYTTCLVIAVIVVILITGPLRPVLAGLPEYAYHLVLVGIGLVTAVASFFLVRPIGRGLEHLAEKTVARVQQLTMTEIISTAVGLIIGLIIASLIGAAVARIGTLGTYLAILCLIVFSYLGAFVGYRESQDVANWFSSRSRSKEERTESGEQRQDKSSRSERRERKKGKWQAAPKVLDTSVIIDGRILDIYRSGFLEGDLVVSGFVLAELRHIADSSDSLKRNRGRGGLDCLNQMREEFEGSVLIDERDYPEIAEVDVKLLRLAQDLQGVVVTNDYNLNKVAQLQGMQVLNINELSNAVKPIALPGEEMAALIVKEGKEINQGVAYLDDGTMIVVENGRSYIGKRLQVVVTSILQTAAGRMVFAKPKQDKAGNVVECD